MIFFWGCSNNQSEKRDLPIQISTQKILKEQVFEFVATKDLSFCNPDSVVAGDCNGGMIWITRFGKVFYSFFCIGQSEEQVFIGTYVENQKEILCTFNESLSFRSDETSSKIINDAQLNSLKNVWKLSLKKLNCKSFPFAITCEDSTKYVLKFNTSDFFKSYVTELKQQPLIDGYY